MWRLLLTSLTLGFCPWASALENEPAPAAAPNPQAATATPDNVFQAVSIENAQFTSEKIGLIQHECEALSAWLAAYVGNELAEKTLRGEAAPRRLARRMLAFAFHLHPANPAAGKVNETMAEGKPPPRLAQDGSDKELAVKLHALAVRLNGSGQPRELILAGVMNLLAADLDPTNENAIYAAEIFETTRRDKPSIWKDLIRGKRELSGRTPAAPAPAEKKPAAPAEDASAKSGGSR